MIKAVKEYPSVDDLFYKVDNFEDDINYFYEYESDQPDFPLDDFPKCGLFSGGYSGSVYYVEHLKKEAGLRLCLQEIKANRLDKPWERPCVIGYGYSYLEWCEVDEEWLPHRTAPDGVVYNPESIMALLQHFKLEGTVFPHDVERYALATHERLELEYGFEVSVTEGAPIFRYSEFNIEPSVWFDWEHEFSALTRYIPSDRIAKLSTGTPLREHLKILIDIDSRFTETVLDRVGEYDNLSDVVTCGDGSCEVMSVETLNIYTIANLLGVHPLMIEHLS